MKEINITIAGKTMKASASFADVSYPETLTKSTFSSDIVTGFIGEVSNTGFDDLESWIEIDRRDKTYKIGFMGLIPDWAEIGKRVKVNLITGTIEPIKAKEADND